MERERLEVQPAWIEGREGALVLGGGNGGAIIGKESGGINY
jgi:hypothetical protein